MSLIVSCSSLYLCLFAKLLGQSKSTCCSAKLSTLRLFSLSCEQSVRWKRIPWSRSCECLSVHQQPGFFAQSIAWEQHGTRRQKPPAIRTLVISQHAADCAKIYAIVPSCSIYFQHVSSILEISLKMGNSHGLSLDFHFLYRFIAISRGKIWADVGRWWWTSGWNGVTCLQKTHMSNLNQNNSPKVTGGLWETYLRSAVETEWSTASSSAGDSLTIFAKWGHWSSQVQMQPETNITHVSTFIIYVCTYIYIYT